MSYNTLENLIISTSGTHSFHFEGQSGEKHITVLGGVHISLFFFIYDTDIKLIIDVVEPKTSISCSAIVVSANTIKSSLDLSVVLKESYTKADIYTLSLLGNNAKAVVNGGIVISPHIIQAEGYLSEENILLGEKIQIKALPMLDVRSSDVKASHGAKIDRLDGQKLFYLTAKGLPKAQAEHLMMQSYIQKALDHAKVEDSEALIDYIFSLLLQ